jgi:WD40 repeat protein
VWSLVFSPDGKKLISSSSDQTIRTWDMASQKCLDVLRGHRLEVWRLALLSDGKTLVSGCKDGTVCFWDTSVTHLHQARITLPMENVVNWNFAPDGLSILTLDQQGQVAQWSGADFQQQSPLLEVATNAYSSCFSPDGRFLAAIWTNGIIQVWNPSQRVLLHQMTNSPGNVWALNCLADGKKLITFSVRDHFLHEWNLTTSTEIQSWPAPRGFIESFASFALTPDERSFMAIRNEGDVVFRSLADASQTKLNLDVLEPYNAFFSPDGKLLAVTSSLGYAKVWEVATWKPVATIGGFLNGVKPSSFAPDGKRLAVASNGKEAVRLCDTESWQDVLTLESQGTGSGGARFSPDGNDIIWANPTTLYLWRAPSWADIESAEAKDPPSPGYGGQGKAETKQP